MRVINTDGMALIGPGSEWLWTALQFVALAVTGLAAPGAGLVQFAHDRHPARR